MLAFLHGTPAEQDVGIVQMNRATPWTKKVSSFSLTGTVLLCLKLTNEKVLP